MVKVKRLLTLSGLTSLLAAAAFAAPASADVKAECTVTGDAKVQDKDDPNLGVLLVEGEGKFTFQQIAINCVGDSNKDGIPEVLTGVGATATGWYDNTVCGTGKALGTVTDIRNAPADVVAVLENKKFGIEFRGGSGVFKWHDEMADPKDIDLDKPDPESSDPRKTNDDKEYSPAGSIQLGPPAGKTEPLPNTAAGECTKAFSATGDVLVHFEK